MDELKTELKIYITERLKIVEYDLRFKFVFDEKRVPFHISVQEIPEIRAQW